MEKKENDGESINDDFHKINGGMMRPGSLQEEKYVNYLMKKYKKIGETRSICIFK